MDCLTCALLGTFQASFGDKPLPPFRTSKTQALLVYLVVEAITADGEHNQARTSHPREALMELLWPNLQLRAAQDNLRQTLYQLRKAIPDQHTEEGAPVRVLESSRLTVGINPAYHFSTDVAEFLSHLHKGQLETAVSLYRGDFLANFYLTDSNDFEEWAQVHRNSYRRQAVNALDRLAVEFLENGRYEKVLQVTGQQLVIDDLNEGAYRQLMEAQARLGRRLAALASYEILAQKLEEELGVAPSLETEQLLAQIQKDEIRAADQEPQVSAAPQLPPIEEEKEAPLFVGRETELDELAAALQKACEGKGSLQFITGGAGRGKTALVSEFATRALLENEELLVLSGQCRGLAGMGAPYLPFRHILAQLTGDVSSSAVLGRGQARRSWEAIPDTIPLVVEQGGELIDALLPGSDLRRRAATFSSAQAGWFRRLNERLEHPGGGPPQKEQLFSQVTAVLKAAARIRPLLLVIEDLHWTDAASAGLLFHLTFELAGSCILMLGTYRPEEVHKGDGHPLARIDSELKRQFGDIWLDLSQKDAVQGRDFIDAYLDSEANALDSRFRRELFTHTGGHALFTVELLRALQERGDLYRDAAGLWQARPAVDWGALPARVEGVIEQRFGRLDNDLQQALSIAAVQGETFTAGIVAEIQGLDEQDLVRRLSREVEKRHRLVEAEGLAWQDGRRLARYRFRHQLFQQYLYGELSEGERIDLHKAMGLRLEALAADTKAMAAELAWHFDQAGDNEKALTYLLQAGDAARLLYATEEAVAHYERALAILKARGDNEKAARILMKLGLTHSNAFDFEAAQKAYDESFALSGQSHGQPAKPKSQVRIRPLRLLAEPEQETLDLINEGQDLYGFFPGLVQTNVDLDVSADVAHSWEISDDGRTYLFHLRDDVFWSDGVPVKAGDYVFAWRRFLDPNSNLLFAESFYDIAGAAAYHQGRQRDPQTLGLEALDEHTLRVRLEKPAAHFLQLLTKSISGALPQHVVEAFGEQWIKPEHIVSAGPMLLDSSDEEKTVLRRNPGYYGPSEGNVQRIEIRNFHSEASGLELYEAGEVDIINLWPLDIETFKQARQKYAYEYLSGPVRSTFSIGFPVTVPPFDDPRVRRAFVLATDRETLAAVHEAGRGQAAMGGFVPPGMPGHVPGIGLPYDPDQARQLLAEAGYPGGENMPEVKVSLVPWDVELLPEFLLCPWEETLGIKIKWEEVTWETYFDRVERDQPTITTFAWQASYPDPDHFLRMGINTLSRWQNEEFKSLIDQAARSSDHQYRLELFKKAEMIFIYEAPFMPLYYLKYHQLIKPWVKNYRPKSFSRQRWHQVIMDPQPIPKDHSDKVYPSAELPPAPQTLRIADLQQMESLDLRNDWVADYGLFPGLVRLSPELDIIPEAASQWEILNGGCTYIFHLRDDIFWSDGRPVTASDFVYALKRALDPENGSPDAENLYDIAGAAEYHQGREDCDTSLGFEALDNRTLKVDLVQPVAYFLQVMGNSVAYAMPRHVVEAFGESWTDPENIVSCGPYKLHTRDEQKMVFVRDPDFYGKFKGNVERVEFHFSGSLAERLSLYGANEVDVCEVWLRDAFEFEQELQKFAGQFLNPNIFATAYYVFDVTRPPFDDPRVRRAFALATDRQQLATAWGSDQDPPAMGGLVPPGIPGHVPDIAPSVDPVKARELLAEAGYPGGKNLPPLSAVLLPIEAKRFPEVVFKCWENELGVRIFWKEAFGKERVETIQREQPHIYIIGWQADYPDPDNFLRVAVRKNCNAWRHEKYKSLIDEARMLGDNNRRLELYRQAEEILVQEAPLVPFSYYGGRLLVKPWVKNYRPGSVGPNWHKVIIEPHEEPVRPAETQRTEPDLPAAPHAFRVGVANPPDDPAGDLYPGLVKLSLDLDIVPYMARSWEIRDGGCNYLFHLREDVFWSDGRPLTAGDFIWALRGAVDPQKGSPYAEMLYDIIGVADFHQGNTRSDQGLGFEALDDQTVRVKLVQPTAHFLQLLTMRFCGAVPRHVFEPHGDDWEDVEHNVGYGPYLLQTQNEGVRVYGKNASYRGQFPGNVERVVLRSGFDLDYLGLYQEGELDAVNISKLRSKDFDRALQLYANEYKLFPALFTEGLKFNLDSPPFNDPRLRRAFVLATDRERLANEYKNGQDAPATGGFVPPGMPGHVPGIGLPIDPQQARRLLAEAGYPGGQNLPTLKAILPPWQSWLPGLLSPQWRENLGVNVTWTIYPSEAFSYDAYREHVQKDQPHLSYLVWKADYADPDDFLRVGLRWNSSWQHKRYDALIDQAKLTMDQAKRLDLFRQAEEILVQEAPFVQLLYLNEHFIVKPWIRNYHPSIISNWQHVIIEPHADKKVKIEEPISVPEPQPQKILTLPIFKGDLGPGFDPIAFGAEDYGLFPGLVQLSRALDVVPDAAQYWEILDNGRKYRFHLRDDVFWSDGRRVTAVDFIYAWYRMLDPQKGLEFASLFYDIEGAVDFHQGQGSKEDVGIKALDERTLEIRLYHPTAYFIQLLCHHIASAVPRHVVVRCGQHWTDMEHLVTCGPFRVQSLDEKALVLRRDPAYHGRVDGNVEGIEYRFYPNFEQQLADYNAHLLDTLGWVPPSMRESPHFSSEMWEDFNSRPGLRTAVMIFDDNQRPFDDPRVRRAFVLATDRRRFADEQEYGRGTAVTGGFVPPSIPGHVPDIGLPFDPTAARRLLAEAGFPGGQGMPVVKVIMQPYNEQEEVQRVLKPWQDILGIEIEWQAIPYDEFFAQLDRMQPHIQSSAWEADYPDPDSFLRVAVNEITAWHDDTYIALVEEARTSLDHNRRRELFHQAEVILAREAPLMPLLYLNDHRFVRPWIKNYQHHVNFKPHWHKVTIEPH